MRVSYTWRCRILLLLWPIVIPLLLLTILTDAVTDAAIEFGRTISISSKNNWYLWYRQIYRPSIYGSVYDVRKTDE